jgi:hypothetical protein
MKRKAIFNLIVTWILFAIFECVFIYAGLTYDPEYSVLSSKVGSLEAFYILDLMGILFLFPAVFLLLTASICLREQSLEYRKERLVGSK